MEQKVYQIYIITIFPELFNDFFETSFIKRARQNNILKIDVYNLRDFALDKHKKVDDEPFGGGGGMIMKPEPIFYAIRHIKNNVIKEDIDKTKTVLLTPQGRVFNQSIAKDFANNVNNLILICGRYEGFDERVLEIVDEELSIGDFVLNGGEIPAMVVSEAIVRLLPGVLGNNKSFEQDSFYDDVKLLDYPQYTRPAKFENFVVPEVLLTGDHKNIEKWRKEQSLLNTYKKRPDLLKKK